MEDNGAAAVQSISDQLSVQRRKEESRVMEEALKALVHQRGAVKGKLTRVKNAIVHSATVPNANIRNVHFLKLHVKTVENCYSEYNAFQNQIYALPLSDERRREQEDRYVEFEALYNELTIQLSTLLEEAMPKPELLPPVPLVAGNAIAPVAPAIAPQHFISPLTVPLPTFDGTYEAWYSFKSMFQNVMARYATESPAIKLYHLRNALVGKAAGVIDQDIINNGDYEAAWAILTDRFEDKRLIIDKHIEAIFSLPKISKDSSTELRKLVDTCVKNVQALENLELEVDGLGEQMLINQLASKMDQQDPGELSSYADTIEFLKQRCRIMEKVETNSAKVENPKPARPVTKSKTLVSANELQCTVCNNSHELYKCEEFKKKSVSDKYSLLRKSGACFNCLGKGHRTTECSSSSTCRKCSRKHHTLLHPEESKKEDIVHPSATRQAASEGCSRAESSAASAAPVEAATKNQNVVLCVSSDRPTRQTLLTTAVVMVNGYGNVLHPCRTLIDSCSQNHFVTERFATQLALKKHRADYQVSGLNGVTTRIHNVVRTTVKSRVTSYSTELELLVAPKITSDMPEKAIDVTNWNLPVHVELADPNFNKRGRIDMLLGAEIFWDLINAEKITLAENLPSLRSTELGWVIGGVISDQIPVIARTFCNVVQRDDLGDLLKRFWEIEGAEDLRRNSTASTDECIQHFRSTFQRMSDGRFQVRLPFNERKTELGESLQMATRRFLMLERRLDQRPELKAEYSEFIHEYERLGHMCEIQANPNEKVGSSYYLPHHCVLRPSSATTKLRVVFDGSAKTSTGTSINDTLKIGPIMQNDLVSILLNFRCYRFVFTADIPKMFRQVMMHAEDAPFQRILWRDDRSKPLKTFELRTVTYGLASSPFHATMALSQLADDSMEDYPIAAPVLKKSFYIDDALCGARTIEEAQLLCRQLLQLLHSGGFDAHKWCSNEPAILEEIPKNLWGTTFDVGDAADKAVVKTLGVVWNASQDWFSFRVQPPEEACRSVTRKGVLSEIAKFFDPLGLAGPVVTTAKLIFREVGLLNLGWDDPIPDAIAEKWRAFRTQLPALNDLEIPRWILSDGMNLVELHGFADASDQAYGTCLYTSLVLPDGAVKMNLICSKSRILPKKTGKMKPITTPRAELLAALLLSREVTKVLNSVDTRFDRVTLWSDSQIVLCWIRKSPADLQLFVANRVIEIQKLTNEFQWRYIPTYDNTADLISRGEMPQHLIHRSIWWNGPDVLNQQVVQLEQPSPLNDSDLPEIRTCLVLTKPPARLAVFDRIGTFTRLQRCMSLVVRFTHYVLSGREMLTKGPPTAYERDEALKLIVRCVQEEAFQPELRALKEGGTHRLRSLHPFIDPVDGILRVGGRVKKAFIPYDSRHQMLLPPNHPFTELLIRHEHQSNLHAGQKALLAIVRQRFWPLQAKNTIRKVIRHCIPCFRANPMKTTQLMSDLPSYRVQPSPAFFHTGIDYAGPFLIKSLTQARKPMITKGYVCLFVCLSTRAIHLELVSSLTTEAFLATLRRFTGRRGPVSKIYSDNATNFVGAEAELEQLGKLFADEHHIKALTEFCGSRSISWSFIPPRSPHFGGIWESGVKSVKHHLRVVGSQKLTFEEMSTVLVQIESVLNSRPLTPCSDDPNDLTAVTPAHFLVGRQMQSIPEPSYTNMKLSTLTRWQLVQATQQHFWKRWLAEYLPELQKRQKWFKTTQIKPGALVLINDPNAPPMQWQLGRIIEAHPGSDNITRVVTLRTARGECKRGVTEISLLPLDQEEQKLDH
ncbi:uncharacterized protein LOC134285252 [Aedes albopictus]|uniref:Integrase catalytic domain-containing protein n=1 Tax=Aedes albopictus TaxID=7160 RepID=A0ABM1ZPW2_AEDAL